MMTNKEFRLSFLSGLLGWKELACLISLFYPEIRENSQKIDRGNGIVRPIDTERIELIN